MKLDNERAGVVHTDNSFADFAHFLIQAQQSWAKRASPKFGASHILPGEKSIWPIRMAVRSSG